MAQGSVGTIRFDNDFTGGPSTSAAGVPLAGNNVLGGGVGLIGVNEGVLGQTVDEPGGILAITTDTGDNDNHALYAGTFQPSTGGTMWMEARFKIVDSVAAARAAVWCGFTETLALDTPVMPAETATTTTTYNGTGGMAGIGFDSDATTIAWRATFGDGGAALASASIDAPGVAPGTVAGAIGTTANRQTVTADRWVIARVEIAPNGIATVYFGDIGSNDALVPIAKNTTALGVNDCFHAVLMIENRSGADENLEVDYFRGGSYRDWAAD